MSAVSYSHGKKKILIMFVTCVNPYACNKYDFNHLLFSFHIVYIYVLHVFLKKESYSWISRQTVHSVENFQNPL